MIGDVVDEKTTVLAFGEIMMRLSPPENLRLEQATSLEVRYGGAEANAALSLAFQGDDAAFVSIVPANRIGFVGNGGPFSLMQLKVIQEVITLVIFSIFSVVVFRGEALHWNHLAAFACLVLAVYFVFMK